VASHFSHYGYLPHTVSARVQERRRPIVPTYVTAWLSLSLLSTRGPHADSSAMLLTHSSLLTLLHVKRHQIAGPSDPHVSLFLSRAREPSGRDLRRAPLLCRERDAFLTPSYKSYSPVPQQYHPSTQQHVLRHLFRL
jgi:hypothetical protein